MNAFPLGRFFRLSPRGIECDEDGLRVGDVALLARNATGVWTLRDERELGAELSGVYGVAVDVGSKRAGLLTVASALQAGNLARAQIAALLLQLPDPPPLADDAFVKADRGGLARDLVACGLLKADDEWEEAHPRTGAAPNPGWFAPKPKEPEANKPPDTATSAGSAAPAAGGGPQIQLVADNSGFHNLVRDKLLADLNAAGNVCFAEFNLDFNGVDVYLDILCRDRFGVLTGVEVKTGDTDYTDNQKIVYPHVIEGAGVISNDRRITSFGFQPGEILPAFDIELAYASGPGSELRAYSLKRLMSLGIN